MPGFARPAKGPFGLCGRMLSLAAILVAVSLHPKIPFLADKAQRSTPAFIARALDLGRAGNGGAFGTHYCSGFNPSASNCRHHSAGASRSRSMLMPRGRRPSTAKDLGGDCPASIDVKRRPIVLAALARKTRNLITGASCYPFLTPKLMEDVRTLEALGNMPAAR